MKITELCDNENFTLVVKGCDKELESAYAGDFLSNTISKAPDSCAWFTVMNNVNVAAVAVLIGCAGIILCEGVVADQLLINKAQENEITILSTKLPVFEACVLLSKQCGF